MRSSRKRSNGTTSAPILRTLPIFIAGASAGMAMTALTPNMAAEAATPCAWLPEEKATTPRLRSSSLSDDSLL